MTINEVQTVNIPLSSYQVISQRGVALVVSLVMLVAITLIGVFVMSNSHLEWLMTNNSRFQSDAFMLAESTLKAAEATLTAEAKVPDHCPSIAWGDPFYNDEAPLPNPDGLFPLKDPNKLADWNNFTTSASALIDAPSGTTNNYVIDYLGCTINASPVPVGATCGVDIESIYTYRVWARSISGNGASRIIRSTFTWPKSASNMCYDPHRISFTEISS